MKAQNVCTDTRLDTPYLLFLLDTGAVTSPFDVCLALSAGFRAVIPYGGVTPFNVQRIVMDSMLLRGPEAVKHTCFFIGGVALCEAEEVLKVVKDSLFPSFEASIVIDPAGAFTTTAAAVAKIEEALASFRLHGLSSLETKQCVILGTGVVGRIAAVLLSRLGCDVTIASLDPKRDHGEKYAIGVAEFLDNRYGVVVKSVFAPTTKKRLEVMKSAQVIFCAAARGVRIIEKDLLKRLKPSKIIADINATPPLGIECVKLEDDMREIMPGILGIGALTIDKLKNKVAKRMLEEARVNAKGVYNYDSALMLARKILRKKIRPNDALASATPKQILCRP